MTSGVTFAALTGAAVKAVATVGACAAVGVYAHRHGLLDGKTQKTIDKLIAEIFLPCLILGKVTPNMSFAELLDIWPLIAMCGFVVVFGLGAGALVSRGLAARWPGAFPKYKGLVMVALAFPNSFSVPITLLLAIGDHPVLVGVDGQGGDTLRARVALLFLMSYSVWVLARWSIGYPILSGALSFAEWRAKALNSPVKACLLATVVGLTWDIARSAIAPGPKWGDTVSLFTPVIVAVEYAGRCTVPLILFALGARLDQAIDEVRTVWAWPPSAAGGGASKAKGADPEALSEVVGLSAHDEAHSMPAGKDFATPGIADAPEPDAPLPFVAYPIVLLLRQVVGPGFSALVACGFLRDICGVRDRVLLMVAMMQGAGPPMINLSVMAGISGSAEMETSKLLLFTYGASVITWTLSISAFLWLLVDGARAMNQVPHLSGGCMAALLGACSFVDQLPRTWVEPVVARHHVGRVLTSEQNRARCSELLVQSHSFNHV
eukprot:CAMPEP_0203861586 /NCGR_PEP_ID=MMETSP0359-20131031/13092_1 /ASSEMBLY_ACC=CAM_ASM_000338 /TAXON_ID=268821 /ORGANISM="Scrippsiella Hangoei, Strain SHTV-5" /LENGTH=490 /DNA_ID=CAMNT_0050778841 /DNA_START=49 /DNA_END=1518 /DNA_ORIENTATION=-